MLLYIHGFGSCARSNKFMILSRYFSVIAPDLPPSPKESIAILESIIRPNLTLIGSSLGGFYAIYLAEKYGLKAILLNPSLKPHKTLKPYTGIQYRYCDNKPFIWKKEYLKELKSLKTKPKRGEYLVLLKSKDEVLNYKKAVKKFKNYPKAKIVVEIGGNHRFEDLENYISIIDNFKSNTQFLS